MELEANKVHMNLSKRQPISSSFHRKPLPKSVFTSHCDKTSDSSDEDDIKTCNNQLYGTHNDQNIDYEDFDLTKLTNTSSSSSSSSSSSCLNTVQDGDMPYSEVLRYLTFSNPYAGKTQIEGYMLRLTVSEYDSI